MAKTKRYSARSLGRRATAASLVAALSWTASGVNAQIFQPAAPHAANDWLAGEADAPEREISAWRPGIDPARPPGAENAAVTPPPREGIRVTRLDRLPFDSMGLMSPAAAGIDADLWAGSGLTEISALITEAPARLPVMRALLKRVLTARLSPPDVTPEEQDGILFLARADRLLALGEVERSRDLLASVGPTEPRVFPRLFDIALLQGDEHRACMIMERSPGIAPSFATRIFCLAQAGDWPAAALTLHGADQQGLMTESEALLLTHFLDDALVDTPEQLEPPRDVTPLAFRIHEAVGQPLPAANLPLPFARSDMRAHNGWKARLEAAERLTDAGALPSPELHDLYLERQPAASGGVWDRASAYRKALAELEDGEPGEALDMAFARFAEAGMGDTLAELIARRLPETAEGKAQVLRAWQGLGPADRAAQEQIDELLAQADEYAIEPPQTGKGAALLRAMADIDAGLDGGQARAAKGLAMLRALGFTTEAAQAATQLVLADKMGLDLGWR